MIGKFLLTETASLVTFKETIFGINCHFHVPLCLGSSSCCRAEVLPESRVVHYSCPVQISEIPAVALSPFSWESWHKAAHQRAYNKHLNICLFIQTAETWGDLFIMRAGSHTIEFEFPFYFWWKAWTNLGPIWGRAAGEDPAVAAEEQFQSVLKSSLWLSWKSATAFDKCSCSCCGTV